MRATKTFVLFRCVLIGGATASAPHRPKIAAGISAAVSDGIIATAPVKVHSNREALNGASGNSHPHMHQDRRSAALLRHEPRGGHHVHGDEIIAHDEVSESSSLLEQNQAPDALPSDPWPLTVEYGVLLKKFYGLSFDDGGWRGDFIVATRWTDSRAGGLVPTGKQDIVMSSGDAAKKMWLPDIVITNLNFAKPVEISSTITVDARGKVTKVMRCIAKLISELDPKQFPFDSQTLKVRLASSTFMFDRLVMEPMQDKDFYGMSKGAFKGNEVAWNIDETVLQSVEETDGPLKKSRGEFIITMTRNWQFFLTTVILPEFLLVVLAWTAFFFPLMPPFAMPKVASTMIPLLAMLAYMNRTASMFPAKATWLWICVYEEICTEMLVFAIIGNLAIESTFYVFKNETLGHIIRSETRILYVCLWCLLFFIVQQNRHGEDFGSLALTVRGIYIFILVAYIVQAMARNYGESHAQENAAAAADADAKPAASDEKPAEEADPTAAAASDEKDPSAAAAAAEKGGEASDQNSSFSFQIPKSLTGALTSGSPT